MFVLIAHIRPFLELFEKFGKKSGVREVLKLKTAVKLQAVLDVTREQLQRYQSDPSYCGDPVDADTRAEKIEKLTQIRAVLEKGGYFSGINRKVQLKPMKWQPTSGTSTPTGNLSKQVSLTNAFNNDSSTNIGMLTMPSSL